MAVTSGDLVNVRLLKSQIMRRRRICYRVLMIITQCKEDNANKNAKKNTSQGNEVLPQDTMRLIQRPCYKSSRQWDHTKTS